MNIEFQSDMILRWFKENNTIFISVRYVYNWSSDKNVIKWSDKLKRVVMTMEKTGVMLEKEAPVKGIVAQVVTIFNGQAQRYVSPQLSI